MNSKKFLIAMALAATVAGAAPLDRRPVRSEPLAAGEISDRLALKELVDTFANLADEKRIRAARTSPSGVACATRQTGRPPAD